MDGQSVRPSLRWCLTLSVHNSQYREIIVYDTEELSAVAFVQIDK